MKLDTALMQEVARRCGGEEIHTALNLLSAYLIAVRQYRKGDAEFLPIAQEAERRLRAFLVKLRLEGK